MTTYESLNNKVVIVTGGTRGIGFATVLAFLKQGAKVAMLGSKEETIHRALQQLKEYGYDTNIRGYYPNLNNADEIKEMLADIQASFGSIDILVNNAGISDAKSLYDYDDEHFEKVMKLNVDAAFRMIRLVAPLMKAQGKGAIVNTSSMVSLYAQRIGSAYPTSKFAINGLTKSLARELGVDGIRVNAVAPGIIETDMVKALDSNLVEQMKQGIPLRRLGQGEDIAQAILFLASDAASFITGAILSVDGGFVG